MYVYYLTRGFIASTRGFNLLTRAFNLPNCAFNLATRAFSLLTGGFELLSRVFELVIRGFEPATRRFELVTRIYKLAFPHIAIILKDFQTMLLTGRSSHRRCSLKNTFRSATLSKTYFNTGVFLRNLEKF